MPTYSLSDHAPAVYWFWHSIPTQAEITRQLNEMYQAGIRTFYVQARLAMPRQDYLSDAYFVAYRQAMQDAKELGMTAGIYDDYNWDSGQAGGRTVAQDDSARERHLFWSQGRIERGIAQLKISDVHSLMYTGMGEGILQWIYENGQPVWGDWHLYRVLALRGATPLCFERDIIDITQYASVHGTGEVGCALRVDLPSSLQLDGYEVVAYVSGRCLSSRLINYLSKAAVNSFVQAGYEPYRRTVSEYFGNVIRSIFFDHPYAGFYDWQERKGEIGNSLMFTTEFPAEFETRQGYPLEKALLAFLYSFGDLTVKLRCDFFETYGQVAREAFFGTVADWAHHNGLALTGHELLAHVGAWGYQDGFTFLDARTNYAADYFSIDAYRDLTAVDASNYHAQISAKLGDSVAKANGRRGCSIEQYAVSLDDSVPGGAGQWGLTLAELRAQAIRHALFGASQFIFHAFYQTDGSAGDLTLYRNARFDFAPGLNFEPWFAQYAVFSQEVEALTNLIQRVQTAPAIAVLFPLRTWWAADGQSTFSKESADWFQLLLKHGLNFDIISEDQLEAAEVGDGGLKIGHETYPVLIFPGIHVLRSENSLKKVEEFSAAGGCFIASGCLPDATQAKGREDVLHQSFEKLVQNQRSGHFCPHLPTIDEFFDICARAGFSSASFRSSGEAPVWAWQSELEGDWFCVCFNDFAKSRHLSILSPSADLSPFRIDLKSGKEQVWPWYRREKNRIIVEMDMEANGLVAFVFRRNPTDSPHLVDSDFWVNYVEGTANSLSLRFEDVSRGGEFTVSSRKPLQQVSTALPSITKITQVETNLWRVTLPPQPALPPLKIMDWKLTLPGLVENKEVDVMQGWEAQYGPDYAGKGIYRALVELPALPDGVEVKLVLPGVETTAAVLLNGHNLGEIGWPEFCWRIPREFLRVGANALEIDIWNTAANHYYAGTPYQPQGKIPSGLVGVPSVEFIRPLDIHCS